jgi:hypothetical protein
MKTETIIRPRFLVSPAALARLIREPQRMPSKAARQAARLAVELSVTRWLS